jgi:hypothetical protein
MANFYVGQRVRIVGCCQPRFRYLVGRQATLLSRIESFNGSGFEVDIDGVGSHRDDGYSHHFLDKHLAPLTPPHEAGQRSVIEALMPSLRDMRELA